MILVEHEDEAGSLFEFAITVSQAIACRVV